MLNGSAYAFTGVNAYEAATDWGVNAGCGPMLSDAGLVTLFTSLKPGQVLRFWAFQALATNYKTKALDWSGIDRVINTAARYGVKVIPALSGESGGCDDNHWKDAAWFSGGYMAVFDSSQWPASTPLSFWDYMHLFLGRYAGNPTIAMIELVSEPAPTDPGYACRSESAAASSLRNFFDTVGGEAKRVDRNHLFESGTQGVGECGTQDEGCTSSSWTSCTTHDFGYVEASPGVDVASYHDYGADSVAVTGYLSESIGLARAAGKPLVVGEAGIDAQANLFGCMSLLGRTSLLNIKMSAQFLAGASGFVAWNWVPGNPGSGGCSYDIGPSDPVLTDLANYQLTLSR
jgi:mannan endo-1,4-beta-mannosidase